MRSILAGVTCARAEALEKEADNTEHLAQLPFKSNELEQEQE